MNNPSSTIRVVLATILFAGAGVGAGHAYLTQSSPANLAIVDAHLEAIHITFSEPIEVRFSLFKLYPLDVEPGLEGRQLALAARDLASRVLPLHGDEDARVPVSVEAGGRTSDEINLILQGELRPGAYVVMWRVLSIDTHTTEDFIVFNYLPEE